MSATPRPWRKSEKTDAVVSDQPCPERTWMSPEYGPEDELRYYGGYVVCESASSADRDLIVCAVNAHDALVRGLRDRMGAAHGLAMAVDPAGGHSGSPETCSHLGCVDARAGLKLAEEAQ